MPTVHPAWAVPGSRLVVEHPNLPLPVDGLPLVRFGAQAAQVVAASGRGLRVVVPMDIDAGPASIEIDGVL